MIGSNTFNILRLPRHLGQVVSRSGLGIAPAVAANFDIWVMIAVALACCRCSCCGRQIGRRRGLLFLAYYAAYVAYLILGAQQHDALDEFSAVMAQLRAADHHRHAGRDGDPRAGTERGRRLTYAARRYQAMP